SADGPFSVVTAVGATTAPTRLSIESVAVGAAGNAISDGWHRAAVLLRTGSGIIVALFATPPDASGGAPRSRSLHQVHTPGGQLATDARVALLHLTQDYEP